MDFRFGTWIYLDFGLGTNLNSKYQIQIPSTLTQNPSRSKKTQVNPSIYLEFAQFQVKWACSVMVKNIFYCFIKFLSPNIIVFGGVIFFVNIH